MKKTRLLALLLSILLVAGLASGCATKSAASMDSCYAMAETPKAEPDDNTYWENSAEIEEKPAEEAPAEDTIASSAGVGSDSAFATNESVDAQEADDAADDAAAGKTTDFAAKIIYSASLQIQTTEFDASLAALEQSVKDFGGFVENSDTSGNIRYQDDGTARVVDRYAYYTVRVPADRFEEFLQQSGTLGNITDSSRNAQNVTSQYTDYEARRSSLRTQEDRLLSMLEKAEDVETLIALEQRLADVRYELESIERNLRNLDMKISYSSVDITLCEVEKYTPTVPVKRTFGEKLSSALKNGWDSFADNVQYFVIDVAYSLPGLILFIIIVMVVVIVVVKACRSRKQKREAAERADKARRDAAQTTARQANDAQKPEQEKPENKE